MVTKEISTNYLKFMYNRLPFLQLSSVGMCSGRAQDRDKNDLLDLLLMQAFRACSYDMLPCKDGSLELVFIEMLP